MAILHGSWILHNQDSYLFVWGETWRSMSTPSESSLTDVPAHPLAMTPAELVEWLHSQNLAIAKLLPLSADAHQSAVHTRIGAPHTSTQEDYSTQKARQSQVIALPTYISDGKAAPGAAAIYPVHSATISSDDSSVYLQPWQVEGFCLNPLEAMKFLNSLPLGSAEGENGYLGGALRFWSQIARWSLDLLSRCKFLPTINRLADGSVVAGWRSLIDSSVDSSRLERFAALMPAACRTYQMESKDEYPYSLYVDLPQPPQKLLLGFLNSTIDAQVREVVSAHPLNAAQSPVREWLQALSNVSNTVNCDPPETVERLEAALSVWTAPLQYQLAGQSFRTCFYLHPPASGDDWTLAYFLQAADDPEFLVDAATIWNHPLERWVTRDRTIEQPQETLLRGLGLASRLYATITPSLEQPYPVSCRLTPLQAYEFLKSVALRFEDSGLGVVLPPSLANREGWANRLGLKIRAATPRQKQERLGLHSLLNFKWELAIGGQTLSKTEFDRLVALNSPLVEINGEWVELRSQDIKTAQAFFASRKDKLALSRRCPAAEHGGYSGN